MLRFADRIVLVTGSGEGIGRATALEFNREGATVVVCDRNEETGAVTAEDLRRAGSAKTTFIKADVSREDDVASLFDRIRSTFGRLDVAVNNAGIEGPVLPIEEQPTSNLDAILSVNIKGTFLCLREEVRLMKPHGAGVIINLASIAAHVGFAGLSIYTASKHAIHGMTKAVALENARSGIRVASVSPGVVQTEMLNRFFGGDQAARDTIVDGVPLGRTCSAEEIARAILFMASDDAALMVGQTLNLDGGWAFVKS
jgi:NAD(P)-dependent dehydrogenase (short-subunit alcohol dehydrogenase family)